MKQVLYAVIFLALAAVQAQDELDLWNSEYDNFYDYSAENNANHHDVSDDVNMTNTGSNLDSNPEIPVSEIVEKDNFDDLHESEEKNENITENINKNSESLESITSESSVKSIQIYDDVMNDIISLLEEYDTLSEDFTNFENLNDKNDTDDYSPKIILSNLNSDLDKLLDKLGDNDSDFEEQDEMSENADVDVNEVDNYEEKYNRPYKEAYILSLRNDNENFDDSNLSAIFSEHAVNETTETSKPTVMPMDNLIGHTYGDDGLFDGEGTENNEAELVDKTTDTTIETYQTVSTLHSEDTKNDSDNRTTNILDLEEAETASTQNEEPGSTIYIDDIMSNSKYSYYKNGYSDMRPSEELQSERRETKTVAPIYITLSSDEPVIITSPNYPLPYPVNTMIDWIIEGPGTGIEMNMTHFQVNGAVGDYLYMKPGGVDADSAEGIIFSFRLTSTRKYRFTNVNRMFMRFESKNGMPFFTGFALSAKMIWPPPMIREEEPVPEPVINVPTETQKLSLAGVTLHQFHDIKPNFTKLIADMATLYISENNIDLGLNTTLEVTQITRTAVCNIRWPNYETCVEVTFGVPLHYTEDNAEPRLNSEDLRNMWQTYIVKEQFAARLGEMGITEYAIPNDRTVLIVWLVIATGVVISMAMLAFALWRFSCFEDYARMRAYNDTDSINNEKKNLDLYPTPHQALPPLYSEGDMWTDDKYEVYGVDMVRLANMSYIEDMFDFESDEEVHTHVRYTTNV